MNIFFSDSHKYLLLITLLLLSRTDLMAVKKNDHSRKTELMEYALNMPDTLYRDTPEITEYLQQFALNDRELLMLLYYWVAHNVDYDVEKFLEGSMEYTDVFHTLETGLTMCQGYAELLCDFCDWLDMECEVIKGYVKGFGYTRGHLNSPNHLWNAVKLDGQWELFDISWASGHLEPSSGSLRYVRALNEQYVFADPNILILTHFPLNQEWQLLDQPLSKSEFFSRRHNRMRLMFQKKH